MVVKAGKEKKKRRKAKKAEDTSAETETLVDDENTKSESEKDRPRRSEVPAPVPDNRRRAERVPLGTANKALYGRSLNFILSNMGREDSQDTGVFSSFQSQR